MSDQQTSGFCAHCQEQRLFTKHRMQMGVHGILTFLTCGLWLIPFLILYIVYESKPYMCSRCGGTKQLSRSAVQCKRCMKWSNPNEILRGCPICGLQTPVNDTKRIEITPEKKATTKQNQILVAGFLVSTIGLCGLTSVFLIVNDQQRSQSELTSRSDTSKKNKRTNTPSKTPSIAPRNTPPIEDSPDYKSGYKKGKKEGKFWTTMEGDGMPYPIAIRMMADHKVTKEKSVKDKEVWKKGWYTGFVDGYRGLKKPIIAKNKLENLSWDNAKPKVKLHNNDGKHQATIIRLERSAGLIVVKHIGSGIVDKKDLKSLSWYWFVRKDDPALK